MAESICLFHFVRLFIFCVIEAVMLVTMFVYLKFLMKWKKQKWNLAGRGKGLNFIKEVYLKRLCYVLTKLGNFLATCNAMQCNQGSRLTFQLTVVAQWLVRGLISLAKINFH